MINDHPLVLLIDDDRDIHDAIKAILHPLGYRMIGCWTGPSGLAEFRNAHPDVVLLDIMLASPTEGIDIAHQIRADPTLRETPVILISSIGRHVTLNGSGELPAEAYLEKPLQPKVLQDMIERVLRSKRGIST